MARGLRIAGIALALIYAGAAIGSGLDRIAERKPATAQNTPAMFRVNAARALSSEAMRDSRGEEALEHAELAVRRDPADARSISALGGAHMLMRQAGPARAAFVVAGRLGWRDPLTQLYWFDQAIAAGDSRVAMLRLDAILRQSPTFAERNQLFAMVETTAGGRSELVRRLAEQPGWGKTYFADSATLPRETVSLRAIVAESLADYSGVRECGLVAPLTQALVTSGNAAGARRIWQRHCASPAERDMLLADGDFVRARFDRQVTAFDWKWTDDGAVSLAREGGTLTVESSSPIGRDFATQSLALAPGRYRATWRAIKSDGTPAASIGAGFSCSGGAYQPIAHELADAATGRFAGQFAVPAGCVVQSFALRIAPGTPQVRVGGVSIVAD